MDHPQDWLLVEKIFHEAVELPSDARSRFLDEVCGQNTELRREIESLLAQEEKRGLLGEPALKAAIPMVRHVEKSWRLAQGTRIGPYEITASIGAGGMAEVYRARDTKLNRDVAIKVLPEAFARDQERIARFHREAQLLATLNHPRIAAIYGLEESNGICGLALELVDGETLAERIARDRVPVVEALEKARQIAEALEAAHAKGVVHRDLKPVNIKITADGTVKVLDFGLARIFEPGATPRDEMPTSAGTLTEGNIILGTAGYMSPEQARGKGVDKRTDIWAWGCVLYEMLTGLRAFDGDTTTDVMARIVAEEPDWARLPEDTPASIRTLLRRSLQKDPSRRLHDIADARIEIEETSSESSRMGEVERHPRLSVGIAVALAAVAIMIGAGFAALYFRRPTVNAPEIRLEFNTPSTTDPLSLAISPDGRRVAYVASSAEKQQIWIRPLDSLTAEPLAGTEGASFPFWSPDSRSVGFFVFADRKVKRIGIVGGSVQTLATMNQFRGGAWGPRGDILFAGVLTPIYRVSADGGEPTVVRALEPQQISHRFPQFLPDGRHFLYFANGPTAESEFNGVYVGSLDGSAGKRLLNADTNAVYAPPGFLFYIRQGTLLAQRFDAEKLQLAGDPFAFAQQVLFDGPMNAAAISAAPDNGTIVYRTAANPVPYLAWFDRSGKEIGTVFKPDREGLNSPDLSPDGKHVAVFRNVGGNVDVALIEIARSVANRFTVSEATDMDPIWSPDGSRIVFVSNRQEKAGLYQKLSSGSGMEDLLFPGSLTPTSWSSDDRFILYSQNFDIWSLPLFGDRKPISVVTNPGFVERDGQFSHNVRWIAYSSNVSNRFEIYVQPFPGPGEKKQISTNGGLQARWRRDGRELFFIAPDNKLMAVPIDVSATTQKLEAGKPVELFPTRILSGTYAQSGKQQYDVAPDGQRFLMLVTPENSTVPPIAVIMNWAAVPLKK